MGGPNEIKATGAENAVALVILLVSCSIWTTLCGGYCDGFLTLLFASSIGNGNLLPMANVGGSFKKVQATGATKQDGFDFFPLVFRTLRLLWWLPNCLLDSALQMSHWKWQSGTHEEDLWEVSSDGR